MATYKLRDLPQEERPRERLKKFGAEALSLQELIAIILETGNKKENVLRIAQNLLSHFGTLEKLFNASIEELQKVEGIGFAKACRLKAAFKLGERLLSQKQFLRQKIQSPQDVFKLLRFEIGNKKKEHFKILSLDSRNRIISIDDISVGTLNSALVHPREVFFPAIQNLANSIILVHNHPSGDPSPSKNDILVTKKLLSASKILGIPIVDHIILTKDSYLSFKDKGLI